MSARARNPIFGRRRGESRLLIWHRRLGAAAAIVVVLVAATGIALNHAGDLALRDVRIDHPLLRQRYGLADPVELRSFQVGDRWLTWADGQALLDGRRVAERVEPWVGAVDRAGMFVAAAPRQVLLIGGDGVVLERIESHGLPGRIRAIGIAPTGELIVATDDGRFAADDDVIAWRPTGLDADWSMPAALPGALRAAVREAFGAAGVPLERMVLDLHTGRIVGSWGIYVVDAAAVALVALAVTGLVNWARRRSGRAGRPGADAGE